MCGTAHSATPLCAHVSGLRKRVYARRRDCQETASTRKREFGVVGYHVTRGGDVRVAARVPACRHCARMATPCARSLKRRCHFRLKGGTLTETQEQQLDMTGRSAAREPLTHYAGWSCSLRSSPPISHTRRSCSSSRPKPRCPFDRPTVTQARIAGATPPPAGSPRSPPPARCRRSRSEGIHGRSGCSETP